MLLVLPLLLPALFREPPAGKIGPSDMAILHITDVHADPFYDGARVRTPLHRALPRRSRLPATRLARADVGLVEIEMSGLVEIEIA
jgi:hypothetical protein